MLKRYFEAKRKEREEREALEREYEILNDAFYAAIKNGTLKVNMATGTMSYPVLTKAKSI